MAIKGDTANSSNSKGDAQRLRQQELDKFMSSPFEEFAWGTGRQLTGLSLKVKPTSWLLVVKATGRLDGKKVAFIETPSMMGCFEYLATYCYRQRVPLRWMDDRFG